jgi:hypothetical protein
MPRTKEEIAQYKKEWAARNKDKISAAQHRHYLANKEKRLLGPYQWKQTPKGRFATQRDNARRRGIEWKLTFEQWWDIWEKSGKWNERGAGLYMMCRTGDIGPYELGNVRIDSNSNNLKERYSET